MERNVAPYLEGWKKADLDRTLEGSSEKEAQEAEALREELLQLREEQQVPTWLLCVDDLSQGDRTRWDYFFGMSVIEGLNAISFSLARKEQLSENLQNPPPQSSEEFIGRALTQILFTR